VDHAASDGPDSNTRKLGLVDVVSIEKLDLLESPASFFRSMPKSICRTISAREKAAEVRSDKGVN